MRMQSLSIIVPRFYRPKPYCKKYSITHRNGIACMRSCDAVVFNEESQLTYRSDAFQLKEGSVQNSLCKIIKVTKESIDFKSLQQFSYFSLTGFYRSLSTWKCQLLNIYHASKTENAFFTDDYFSLEIHK